MDKAVLTFRDYERNARKTHLLPLFHVVSCQPHISPKVFPLVLQDTGHRRSGLDPVLYIRTQL